MRQVLFNLVGNAIKFTEKGKIRLSIKRETVYEEGSEQDLLIAVEDSGIGIPEKDQERIFESFQQQEGQDTQKYGGTGLGLAICKDIVQKHSGKIWAENRADCGTVFAVEIPVKMEPN